MPHTLIGASHLATPPGEPLVVDRRTTLLWLATAMAAAAPLAACGESPNPFTWPVPAPNVEV